MRWSVLPGYGMVVCVTTVVSFSWGWATSAQANETPIADAGPSRYIGPDAVVLDGSGSYDPDGSGLLNYAWRQIAGPPAIIWDANTSTPNVGGSIQTGGGGRVPPILVGFIQTEQIQTCEFELIVDDGELASVPDTVELIIVPDFGLNSLVQQNPPFDPDKPTLIYFGGGDCVTGGSGQYWSGWYDKANVLSFPQGYQPDTIRSETWNTYYHYGDMIIVYLSKAAPVYTQMIQTVGWSTGGQPALDAGIRLNRLYADPRYAVNHVTELDAPCRWMFESMEVYLQSNELFRTSAVNGEPCRHDHYWGDAYRLMAVPHDILGVYLEGHDHSAARNWYWGSISLASANLFNHGTVAGAFWSVVGPGKNLQLTQEGTGHYFHWTRDGEMILANKAQYPGQLPEPVTLLAWQDKSEPNGIILSCKPSENVVGYELILGTEPYGIVDYSVVSNTPDPPVQYLSNIPSEETWWTVRARDEYGSTIYADPMRLDPQYLPTPQVENLTTGAKYGSIELALHFAESGHEIILDVGNYTETINFQDHDLIVRSRDPNDPNIVASTVISGDGDRAAVVFSGGQDSNCMLTGLTIAGGTVGISCKDAAPTIKNCTVEGAGSIAVDFWYGHYPSIVDCTIIGDIVERAGDPTLIAYWILDETDGATARDLVLRRDGTVHGNPVWRPDGGIIGGAIELDGIDDHITTPFVLNPGDALFSVFVWIRSVTPGQVIVSQAGGANWLCTDAVGGNLMTELRFIGGRLSEPPLVSQTLVTDDTWHRVGLSWDGQNRILYVDGAEVARDTQPGFVSSEGGLYIGTGKDMEAGTFFSGLIDDVRVHNLALSP